ncbi:MAG: MAPEG family protein, partial [Panacagrimonas sp.]
MTGIEALLYYVLLMFVLVLLYVGHRIPLVLLGKKAANYWTRGNTTDDASWQVRAQHAHANMVENIGLFAAIVLTAAVLDRSNVVDPLACWVLYARIGQSAIHLLGTGFIHVLIRATLFVVQLGIMA